MTVIVNFPTTESNTSLSGTTPGTMASVGPLAGLTDECRDAAAPVSLKIAEDPEGGGGGIPHPPGADGWKASTRTASINDQS